MLLGLAATLERQIQEHPARHWEPQGRRNLPGGRGRSNAGAETDTCRCLALRARPEKKPEHPSPVRLKVLLQSGRGNARSSADHVQMHKRLQSVKAAFQLPSVALNSLQIK